jgi:TATA-binding protein-associated factor Taf7
MPRGVWAFEALRSGPLVDGLDLDFDPAEPLGHKVVNRSKDCKEDETENGHDDRHEDVNDRHNPEMLPAEYKKGKSDESVNKAHQNVESSHDLAGLED